MGAAEREAGPSSTAIAERLARVGRAVGDYGRSLAAQVEQSDPVSVERFLRAVAPIDAYRVTRSGGGEVDSGDPTDSDEPRRET